MISSLNLHQELSSLRIIFLILCIFLTRFIVSSYLIIRWYSTICSYLLADEFFIFYWNEIMYRNVTFVSFKILFMSENIKLQRSNGFNLLQRCCVESCWI